MIPDKLKKLRDSLAEDAPRGECRDYYEEGFDSACEALLPVLGELENALASAHDELVIHYNRNKCFQCMSAISEAHQAHAKLKEILE